MVTDRMVRRFLALTLSVVMIVGSVLVPQAKAGLITTEEFRAGQQHNNQDLSKEWFKIREVMDRADVRQQMLALGIGPAEAEERLAALSDDDVRNLAGRLDTLPAGQAVFETAIIAALFAFVILLVTDILGYTDIFPFVSKSRDNDG